MFSSNGGSQDLAPTRSAIYSPGAITQPASESAAEAVAGDASPPSSDHQSAVSRIKGLFARGEGLFRSAVTADGEAASGVHAITKNTNYWFERELHQLDQEASQLGREWAQKGLPRHDTVQTEPLPPEVVLAAKCLSLFRQWLDRVRVMMQDAIAKEVEKIGEGVAEVRSSASRLEVIRSETRALDDQIAEIRDAATRTKEEIGFDPLFGGRGLFWSFAILLTLVEFSANFPVFRLLLPMDAALAEAAQQAAESVDPTSWSAGLILHLREMAMHVEALVVALVSILAIVLLGKTLGSSLRSLMALRVADYPIGGSTVASFRRQNRVLLIVALLGTAGALSFLYMSRSTIADLTQERVTELHARADTLARRAEVFADSSRELQTTARQQVRDAGRAASVAERDLAYASTVQRNNTSILFLNLAIVLTALALGYITAHVRLNDRKGEHPRIAELKAQRQALQRDAIDRSTRGRAAESKARAGIARVQHLLAASPLREWEAKARRLHAVMQLFRTENAHGRGLDPASIVAFRSPPPLELPIVEAREGFREPADFGEMRRSFDEAVAAFQAESPRVTPIEPMVAVK